MVGIAMSTRKMIVELPSDLYDRFKVECAKNHVTVKDEVFKLMCASLDGVEPAEIKRVESSEESVLPPFLKSSVEKEDLDAKMNSILERLDKLESVPIVDYSEACRSIREEDARLFSEQKVEIDKKFKILANFIENHLDLFIKGMGANVCVEDIIGLAVLRGKEIPSTKGLDKRELKDLFHRMMETKRVGE